MRSLDSGKPHTLANPPVIWVSSASVSEGEMGASKTLSSAVDDNNISSLLTGPAKIDTARASHMKATCGSRGRIGEPRRIKIGRNRFDVGVGREGER